MTLTSAYVSIRTGILKCWGHFVFPLQIQGHYNNLKVSVHTLWDRKLDLIKPSLRAMFNKSLCCLIWLENSYWHWLLICLMCYSPSFIGQSDFPGEVTPGSEGQNWQLGKIFRNNYLEKQFKRTTVQKDYTNEETSPDLDKINYARPLTVTKA
jgi:hypothetical protein